MQSFIPVDKRVIENYVKQVGRGHFEYVGMQILISKSRLRLG
ncbi:MAG TPA: hypothetical protein V6C69_17000 [Trichormus sp.]